MQFSTLLATAFALAAVEAKIAFTQVPGSSVTVGKSFTIEWDGAEDDAPVTITLKQGDPDNLTTVALLTGDASGGSYTWTPSSSLVDSDDYALEISQGTGFDQTNYSGEFSITGGASSSSSSSGYPTSGSASATPSVTVTVTSGNSTFVTSHSAYPVATGTGTGSGSGSGGSAGGNGTYTRSTKAPGSTAASGIVVTATSTQSGGSGSTPASTSAAASSSGAAAQYGPVGGAAAALLGLAALL